MSAKSMGLISSEEAYSKSMVMQRLGISQRFWDKLLDEGLPFTQIGHARWVTGRQLMAHLESHSQRKAEPAQ